MAQTAAGLAGELRAAWKVTDAPGQVIYYRDGQVVAPRQPDLREVYPASAPDELSSHPLALEDLT